MTVFELAVLLGLLGIVVALALVLQALWSIEASLRAGLAQQKALDGAILRQLGAAPEGERLVPRRAAVFDRSGGWPDT